jgi:hypothetical protein
LVTTGLNRRMAARELAAWVSAYPLKDLEMRGDDGLYAFDGARRSKADHLFEAARVEADEDAWELLYALIARRLRAQAAADSAALRHQSLERRSQFLKTNAGLQSSRAQFENDAFWTRMAHAVDANGALNPAPSLKSVETAFAAEYLRASAALSAAQPGLAGLFGYAAKMHAAGAPCEDLLEGALDAQAHLATASRLDQVYTLTLSLKELTGSSWEAGRAAARWNFAISEDRFPGQAQVRLQRVQVAVTTPIPEATGKASKSAPVGKTRDFWTARLSLPPSPKIRTLAGQIQDAPKALPFRSSLAT